MIVPKLPEVLEKIVDKVLAYHPKPKTQVANRLKQIRKNNKKKKSEDISGASESTVHGD